MNQRFVDLGGHYARQVGDQCVPMLGERCVSASVEVMTTTATRRIAVRTKLRRVENQLDRCIRHR
jgi:hypothetical protein